MMGLFLCPISNHLWFHGETEASVECIHLARAY